MPLLPQKGPRYMLVKGGICVWDGITKPETKDDGKKSYSLKLIYPANHPDIPLLMQLAADTLAQSEFQGQMPAGGNWPVIAVENGKYGDQFNGYVGVSFKTSTTPPDVYDENG